MTTAAVRPQLQNSLSVKAHIQALIDDQLAGLPNKESLSASQRRGMIARYSSVLEANFIYWMTATYISVDSSIARDVITDNLREEVSECHPAMLRRFAVAAGAFPTDIDALATDQELTRVRLFLGKLQGPQNLATMAFFEAFIQKFMAYLADLAVLQGSTDLEYTTVHGICDVAHSEGLYEALSSEMQLVAMEEDAELFEGVNLLGELIRKIVAS